MKNQDDRFVRVAFNYGRLTTLEREIIEHLYHKPCKGGYTVFTQELARPKSHVSNVRKATRHLRDMGVLRIHTGGKYSYIELREDWYVSLYFAFDIDGVCRVPRE